MATDDIGEFAWQKWQAVYAILRTATFLRLLEERPKRTAEDPLKKPTLLSNSRECIIELTHRDQDPGMWIIRHATRYMWFKKRISSHWFNSELQAMEYAEELKQKHALA